MIFGTKPPTATKANDGSKEGEKGRTRKFWIFEGWSIPARARPKEKCKAMKNDDIGLYHRLGTELGITYL